MFSQTPISLPNTSWKNTSQTPYSRLIDAQGLLAGTTFLFVLFCWWVSSAEPSGLRGPGIPSEKTHLRLWLASPRACCCRGLGIKGHKDRSTYRDLTRLVALFQNTPISSAWLWIWL